MWQMMLMVMIKILGQDLHFTRKTISTITNLAEPFRQGVLLRICTLLAVLPITSSGGVDVQPANHPQRNHLCGAWHSSLLFL